MRGSLKNLLLGKTFTDEKEAKKVICNGCKKEIDANDYCVCTKCHQTTCPSCAKKSEFVCDSCGGDLAYLS